ncbi:MAG: hypothetical protein HYT31_04815 [Parcubacteria group bacterium]|nr:hypothetical protein [Parcubacteria group bacterium]
MKIFLTAIALTGLLAAAAPAHAVSGVNQLKNNLGIIGTETGLGTQGDSSLPEKIAAIVNIALGFVALIGVIMIIYAGFKWMTAGGNEEQIKEAKGHIRNAVIGIVIIMLAFVIVNFTVNKLSETVGVGEGGGGGGNVISGLCEFDVGGGLMFCVPRSESECQTLGGTYNAQCEKQTYCRCASGCGANNCLIMTENACERKSGALSDAPCN